MTELAYSREDRDCAVRALAVACAVPYDEAYKALADAGRRPRRGCSDIQLMQAARLLGYGCRPARLPKRASRTTRSVAAWLQDTTGGYIVITQDHCAGVQAGTMHDWSAGAPEPVITIWKLRKIPLAKRERAVNIGIDAVAG